MGRSFLVDDGSGFESSSWLAVSARAVRGRLRSGARVLGTSDISAYLFACAAKEVHGAMSREHPAALLHGFDLRISCCPIDHERHRRLKERVGFEVPQDLTELGLAALQKQVRAMADAEGRHLTERTGKRKESRAADEEAVRLWSVLTRVVALTPEALARSGVHAATLKLNGVRVCLSCKAGVCSRIDALGRAELQSGCEEEAFVLDAEEQGGAFWVFDALMTQGRDLRPLAMADRLRAAAELLVRLPTHGGRPLRPKPYSGLRSAAVLQRLLLEASASTAADGVIFCDFSGAYETPPLKFKSKLTVDFCLESHPRLPGCFFLLAQKAGQLRRFRLRGKDCVLALAAEERRVLGLPERPRAEDAVIVECALPCERHGRWRAVRRRPDRRHPNCLSTVLDTLAIKARGLDQTLALSGLLPPLSTQAAFEAWLDVLRRRLLSREDAGDEPFVEVHGAARPGCEGSIPVDCCRLALPLKGGVKLRSFFRLTADELEQLFSVLQRWLAGAPRRSLDLLLALQLLPEGLSPKDAHYFKTILDTSAEALLARAAAAFGTASLSLVEEAQPPELLELPPQLSLLAATTHVLRVTARS